MSEHTPGPWKHRRLQDSDGNAFATLYESHIAVEPSVCMIWAPPQSREQEANARLIAAAPDMLQELQSLQRVLNLEFGESRVRANFPTLSVVIDRAIGTTDQQPSEGNGQ